jgi:pilus assembly protein CpaB
VPKNRVILILIVSAILGIISISMAVIFLKAQRAAELTQVVVASINIDSGNKLNIQNLALADWPKAQVPVGASTNTQTLFDRVAKSNLVTGQVVLEHMLMPIGSGASLSAVISPGKRAFTIYVSEAAGVAGFTFPGNYVDVLLSTKDDSGQSVSKIVLEKVLVLAIAQDRVIKDESKPRVVNVVTLEVSPQQAERLDMARSVGSLTLALRNQSDVSSGKTGGAHKGDFEDGVAVIEVIRGTSKHMESGLQN